MRQGYTSKTILLVLFLASIFVYVVFDSITQVNLRKHHIFLNTAKDMQERTKVLIDEKRDRTLAITSFLAQDTRSKKALLENNTTEINLHSFSLKLRKHSDFKNVWFQIITKDGISFYRSWVKKRGDSLVKARMDVAQMIKEPKTMSTISVGKFDLTFKSMVPLYSNDKFIGMIETITHFSSIAAKLNKKEISAVILVDKKYKNQLTRPFTKIFINDYYVANLNANKELMKIIENKKIADFVNYKEQYHIDEQSQQLVTIFHLNDINNKPMSYFILFKPLNSIDMSEISQMKANMLFYMFLFVLVLGLMLYFISTKDTINNKK